MRISPLDDEDRLAPVPRDAGILSRSVRAAFTRPLTFVLLVWGLMFVGLGVVLAYA
ncbi:MAG: hypothetical protein ABI882_18415 [Acidobacteriota bacterium]